MMYKFYNDDHNSEIKSMIEDQVVSFSKSFILVSCFGKLINASGS